MNEIIIPVLFIPTFHGDVRLERIDDTSTRVIVAKATPLEAQALRTLAEYAVKKNWVDKTEDVVLDEGSFVVRTKLKSVQSRLTKALKPGREIVTVVRFTNGKMEEILESPMASTTNKEKEPSLPARAAQTVAAVAAAAVAAPVLGCPPPDFIAAELRANRVLETFLDEEQKEDFRKHNSFVTIGAATGHRLLITSRHAKSRLATFQRSLFDLEDNTPMCVHDWEVPAAEEMLGLHLFASVPAREMYLRQLSHEAV